MSFSADQFMQVKCRFQLTTETDSNESIHPHTEEVRLCASVDFDTNSTLIVMICSNEFSSNHIVAYYIRQRNPPPPPKATSADNQQQLEPDEPQLSPQLSSPNGSQHAQQKSPAPSSTLPVTKIKPKIIVKQIDYHKYNEDISALCLNENGELAFVNASSTIFIVPIKNIILNLRAERLRSSQGKSMYFYDATMIDCCSIENPIAISFCDCKDTSETNEPILAVANGQGQISFINYERKIEITRTTVKEPIKHIEMIRDRSSYSLLITCESLNQYRFAIRAFEQDSSSSSDNRRIHQEDYVSLNVPLSWDRNPISIKWYDDKPMNGRLNAAARVLVPSSRASAQAGLFSANRNHPVPMIFFQSPNLVGVSDALGFRKAGSSSDRLLRFYSSKQFLYRPPKPSTVCKLTSLDPDELITHQILTNKFLVIATDKNRCLVNSKNCCKLRGKQDPSSKKQFKIDPLVKEITFNMREKILLLIKSPVNNDQDNIIDSFLLVTSRTIYSIEARQTSREMFVNLIDEHLGFNKAMKSPQEIDTFYPNNNLMSSDNEPVSIGNGHPMAENSDSNHMISNFLAHRDEVYNNIYYESLAFSELFKVDLLSLFVAYAERLLKRRQYELANKFFERVIFRQTKGTQNLAEILESLGYTDLIRVDKSRVRFLEFLTSPIVIKACAKDASLRSKYFNTHRSPHSLAALSHFEMLKELASYRESNKFRLSPVDELSVEFSESDKEIIVDIFLQYLIHCLDEIAEDSCRLWFVFINYYLNYLGPQVDLEKTIIKILESGACDCRLSITLFRALADSELEDYNKSVVEEKEEETNNNPLILSDDFQETVKKQIPRLSSLKNLFSNEFLMQLLACTLDKIPQSSDLDAITDCIELNGLTN